MKETTETTDTYAEEKRVVFSFDLKEESEDTTATHSHAAPALPGTQGGSSDYSCAVQCQAPSDQTSRQPLSDHSRWLPHTLGVENPR